MLTLALAGLHGQGQPFSFVDDKIFCGNSLLGITSLEQLRALHIYPDPKRPRDLLHELIDVDGKIAEAIRLRKELASPIDEHNPMRSTRGKTSLLEQLDEVTSDLRLIADGVIAAGLPLGGKRGAKLDDEYKVLSWELASAFPQDGSPGEPSDLQNRVEAGLTPTVDIDYERWRPLHWVLEAPDLFVARNGFDAVIGNPPFLVSKRISGAVGTNVRESLVSWICTSPARSRRPSSLLSVARGIAAVCRGKCWSLFAPNQSPKEIRGMLDLGDSSMTDFE